MDGQTDRILIARPRLHFMQRGKNRTLQLVAPWNFPQPRNTTHLHKFYLTTTQILEYTAYTPCLPTWTCTLMTEWRFSYHSGSTGTSWAASTFICEDLVVRKWEIAPRNLPCSCTNLSSQLCECKCTHSDRDRQRERHTQTHRQTCSSCFWCKASASFCSSPVTLRWQSASVLSSFKFFCESSTRSCWISLDNCLQSALPPVWWRDTATLAWHSALTHWQCCQT